MIDPLDWPSPINRAGADADTSATRSSGMPRF
jgi:hypothetical protein